MSFEQALIAQARPHMLSARAQLLLQRELVKGCLPELHESPVDIEPPFRAVEDLEGCLTVEGDCARRASPCEGAGEAQRLSVKIWIAEKQELDWKRAELFLKQLRSAAHPVTLDITGNRNGLDLILSCHVEDVSVVAAAFRGEFQHCELSPCVHPLSGAACWEGLALYDFYPPPPYSHLLTRPDEIRYSPYEPLLASLAALPDGIIGLYQVIFKAVPPEHDYHRNVQILLDIEYLLRSMGGFQSHPYHLQQAPSGDLRQMAGEVETKAHTDKPFFFMAMRAAVLGAGNDARDLLRGLATFASLFQHGGRPLNALTEADYRKVAAEGRLREAILQGQVYRPGFLVNSWELAGPVHIPPGALCRSRQLPVPLLVTFPFDTQAVAEGTQVGVCRHAGREIPVCIPPALHGRHGHIIGSSGVGKTCTLESMILQDIDANRGVAVLDPHGDLVERLLSLCPERHAPRVIYFDPGDTAWVPLWNPLQRCDGQDLGRTADDLVGAFKSTVTGWGDRLEHLLRHAFYAIMQLPDSCFLDVANLLRTKSAESKRIREAFLPLLDNALAREFWRHDFQNYRKEELTPAQHKLSKLLVSGSVSLMLSQPESRFTFHDVIERQRILLVNLSKVGSEQRDVLGAFMLSLLHLTALTRSRLPAGQRTPFYLYCDEAHRFASDSLEDLLAETRKFGLGVVLAHQYSRQFNKAKVDALSGVGSTIIFKVDAADAQIMARALMGRVAPEDLSSLEVGEAVARIGSVVTRIATPPPRPIPSQNFREQILADSRARYCMPAEHVRGLTLERIRGNGGGGFACPPLAPWPFGEGSDGGDWSYDEL